MDNSGKFKEISSTGFIVSYLLKCDLITEFTIVDLKLLPDHFQAEFKY